MTDSKTSKLLRHLQAGKTITGKAALSKFGLYRLSEYIRRFRKDKNMNIVTTMVTRRGVTYASYRVNYNNK